MQYHHLEPFKVHVLSAPWPTQANAPDEDKWTPSETLLLLEGIELYGEEWTAVAEHVGDKMPVSL
jgi:hypothetical protein